MLVLRGSKKDRVDIWKVLYRSCFSSLERNWNQWIGC
jgi:hypothetical protein